MRERVCMHPAELAAEAARPPDKQENPSLPRAESASDHRGAASSNQASRIAGTVTARPPLPRFRTIRGGLCGEVASEGHLQLDPPRRAIAAAEALHWKASANASAIHLFRLQYKTARGLS